MCVENDDIEITTENGIRKSTYLIINSSFLFVGILF